jgi:hypothetical protein
MQCPLLEGLFERWPRALAVADIGGPLVVSWDAGHALAMSIVARTQLTLLINASPRSEHP